MCKYEYKIDYCAFFRYQTKHYVFFGGLLDFKVRHDYKATTKISINPLKNTLKQVKSLCI